MARDYNAYYLLLESELRMNGMNGIPSQTSPGSLSVDEFTLNSEVAYQPGPLGDYYLATSSPLYQTAKRGSRTVADAGLYHFTTRIDQTKDGGQSGDVIIGRHYVATASSTSTQPKDSETPTPDGIPDYVEDQNSDGVVDANETSPVLVQTQTSPPTTDSLNVIYDDIDLDGDGMVGRIEKALTRNPLGSDNPLALAKVTTGNEPDIATFEVGANSSTLSAVGGLNLNVDGVDARLATANYPLGQNAHLAWNTTYNAPGQHFIQAQLALKGALPAGAIRRAAGPLTSFYSPNLVQFFLKESLFNDSIAYLNARIPAGTVASYAINLYDPSTTPRTLIDSITHPTPVDLIRESWPVTYSDHVTQFTGDRVQAEFNVTLTDATSGQPVGSGTSTKEISRLVNSEIGNNVTVAYMSGALASNPSWNAQLEPDGVVWLGMQNVVDALTMPTEGFPVYNSDFNHFFDVTYPNWGDPGYVPDRNTVINRLIPALQSPSNRQFFCNSHGSPWLLCDSWEDAYIDCRELMFWLGNFIEPSAKINVVSNPYRFVFLDGCSAGLTRSWANAFGIFNYWDELEGNSVIGPQAFVGYDQDHSGWLGGPGEGYDPYIAKKLAVAYCATLHYFYINWMLGETSIYEGIKRAETTLGPFTFAPFPTPRRSDQYKGVFIVKCVDGQRIGFFTGTIQNPQSYPVDLWIYGAIEVSRINVIGHQGLTRYGCKEAHIQDTFSDGYRWPDPGN